MNRIIYCITCVLLIASCTLTVYSYRHWHQKIQALEEQQAQALHPVKEQTHQHINTLLHMANESLMFYDDPTQSIRLLTDAAQKIQSLACTDLMPVLADIQVHLEQLNQLQSHSTLVVLKQLHALRDQLTAFMNPQIPKTEHTKSAPPVEKQHPLWSLWQRCMAHLKRAVLIQHQEQPIKPVLLRDQQIQLMHNVDLQLSQVAWAAIHHQEALYQASLAQIHEWMMRCGGQDDSKRQAFLTGIEFLKNRHVHPKLPDLEDIRTRFLHRVRGCAFQKPA